MKRRQDNGVFFFHQVISGPLFARLRAFATEALTHHLSAMKFYAKFLLAAAMLALPSLLCAQSGQPHAGQILQGIQKLNVLGNVLYLAAHPDDENTRFIAWCANEKLLNTSYLSLTRGDGGQNLIGSELREELGLIRTQELVAARKTDGGVQYFTRANDFGYSKTTEETVRIWDEQQVLEDMVYVIRTVRPDVIVCRFPPDSRAGHGHHSASAVLGLKAFNMAADPASFPEQVKELGTWQATRIVQNTGRWWNENISEKDPGVVMVDVGQYNPLLGLSYNEMAAHSRSLHKSQGFGSTGTRGEQKEYFEHYGGKEARSSLFDDIDTGWGRAGDTGKLTAMCSDAAANFRAERPWESVPALAAIHQEIGKLKHPYWKRTKQREVEDLMLACAGFFAEARADRYSAVAGERIKVSFEVLNRTEASVTLKSIRSTEANLTLVLNKNMTLNKPYEADTMLNLSAGLPFSQPFFLIEKGTTGMYASDNQALRIKPENAPAVAFAVELTVAGIPIMRTIPLVHRWNDPVDGERQRPFVVVPPVLLEWQSDFTLMRPGDSRSIILKVTAQQADNGMVEVALPKGWAYAGQKERVQISATKSSEVLLPPNGAMPKVDVAFKEKGEEMTFEFVVAPDGDADTGVAVARYTNAKGTFDAGMRTIAHPHIPHIVHFPPAETKLVLADIRKVGQKVGYINGAGDQVADGLKAMGYEVTELGEKDLMGNLAQYKAIVLGVRALNTLENSERMMPLLFEYCKQGGNVVVQYNVNRGLKTEKTAPLPIMIGRDRVTEENAEVSLLVPNHPVLNKPNKLTPADFECWVQERGLYFASTWHDNFEAPLGMHDTGEPMKSGSLLILRHGKGYFAYTGISFFRQLPAGVPGAFKLMANLISLE